MERIRNRQSLFCLIVLHRFLYMYVRKGIVSIKKNERFKIKSLFIDEKVPVRKRDKWPIVTDRNGTVLWVPLLRKSKFEAPHPKTGHTILLKYIRKTDF